jgi:hypothetical protein
MGQGSACAQRTERADELKGVLEKLVDLTRRQRDAFLANNQTEFMRLDRELELTIGVKERCVGALYQHETDHGCSA